MDDQKPTPGKGKQPQQKQAANPNPASQPPAAPRMVMRGERKMVHHLFSSTVEDCLKNVSYTPKKPKLEPLPHKHFFHTCDNRGRRLTTCSMSNGHFHEVTWESDPQTGELRAKSGPALRKETRNFDDGTSEVVDSEVGWPDARGKLHMDSHTHEWEYVHSEEFSAKDVDALRQANKEGLVAQGVHAGDVKPMQNARPLTQEDGVTIREG